MRIVHESGKGSNLDGILEVDSCDNPVRILLNTREVKKIRISGDRYWFTLNGNKFFLGDLNLKHEDKTIQLHIKQCFLCSRLQKADHCCLNPEGLCSFEGYTKESCSYFK